MKKDKKLEAANDYAKLAKFAMDMGNLKAARKFVRLAEGRLAPAKRK